MRPPIAWFYGLATIAWASAVVARSVDPAAIETATLSACGTKCTTRSLASYACTNNDACFCSNEQFLADVTVCLDQCPFSDQLYFSVARAKVCMVPTGSEASTLLGTAYALFGLATVITLARPLSRWRGLDGEGYWWDDCAAMLSYPFLVSLTASQALSVHAGLGTDLWGLDLLEFKGMIHWLYITTILWTPIVFLTKISLVLLYLRLWSETKRFRWCCSGALVALALGYCAFQIVAIAQCSPASFIWNRVEDARLTDAHLLDAAQGRCIDQQSWIWASSVINVLFDLMVAILPIVKLQRSSKSRFRLLGIVTTYLAGLAVLASGLAKFAYISDLPVAPNASRYYSHFDLIAVVEANFSQICCCLPALTSLLHRNEEQHGTNHQDSTALQHINNIFRNRKPTQISSGRDTPDNEKPPSSSRSFFTKAASFASSPASPNDPRQGNPSWAAEPTVPRKTVVLPSESSRLTPSPQPFVYASDREDNETNAAGKTRSFQKGLSKPLPKQTSGLPITVSGHDRGKVGSMTEDTLTALPPPPVSRGPSPALLLPAKREKRWSSSSVQKSNRSDDRVREDGEDSDTAVPPPISRGPSPAMVGSYPQEKRLSGSQLSVASRQETMRSISPQPRISEDDESDAACPPSIARGPSPLPRSSIASSFIPSQDRRYSGVRLQGVSSRQGARSPPLLAIPATGGGEKTFDSDFTSGSDSDTALPPTISRIASPPAVRQPVAPVRVREDRPPRLRLSSPTLPNTDLDAAIPSPLFSRPRSSAQSTPVQAPKRHSSLRSPTTALHNDERVRSPIIFEEPRHPSDSSSKDDRLRGPIIVQESHPIGIAARENEAREDNERDATNMPASAPIVPRVNPTEIGRRPSSRTGSLRQSSVALMQSWGISGRTMSMNGRTTAGRPTSSASHHRVRPASSASNKGDWQISDADVATAVEEGREKRISGMVGVRGSSDLVPFAKSGKGVELGRTEEWVRNGQGGTL